MLCMILMQDSLSTYPEDGLHRQTRRRVGRVEDKLLGSYEMVKGGWRRCTHLVQGQKLVVAPPQAVGPQEEDFKAWCQRQRCTSGARSSRAH